MKIEKVGETYSVFEETDDPMENMRRRKKVFILFLFCVCFFAMLGWEIIQTMPSKYKGNEEYYEIEGVQIPTLYKYTGNADVFMINEVNDLKEGNIKGSFITIFYNNKMPTEIINTYIDEIGKIGYEKINYEETDLYVKNVEDNTKFIYIFIDELQVKYGVCVSGKYEDILK